MQDTESARRSELILRAVVESSHRLLGDNHWRDEVDGVLRLLGEAAATSRACVFENSPSDDGGLQMNVRFEWDAPGIEPGLADPGNQNLPYAPDYWELAEKMKQGEPATGLAGDFAGDARTRLDHLRIKSMALFPIADGEGWWGFVEFDDCAEPRTWSDVEFDALRAAADAIGSAIRRERRGEQFHIAETKYKNIIEKIPAVTYLDPVDENELSVYVSPQVQTILGCTPDQWLNDPAWWHDHVHPDDEPRVWQTYVEHRESGEALSQEYRMVRDDGKIVWVREEATLMYDETGKPWAIQGLMHDTTEYHQVKEQLAALSSEDTLTGLPNRTMFEQALEPAIEKASGRGKSVAVLVVDLDDFKKVNDECGSHVGDRLIVEVSTRIRRAIREEDVVAREEADRFLVMMPDLGSPDPEDPESDPGAEALAKTRDRIETLMRAPAALGGNVIKPSVSIGASTYPQNARNGSALLKEAETAMYRAKAAKRAPPEPEAATT